VSSHPLSEKNNGKEEVNAITKKILFVFVLALLSLAVAMPVAFAQTATNSTSSGGPPPFDFASMQTIQTLGLSVPVALVVAIVSCLAGYLAQTPPESFSLAKFLYTFMVSVIVGFFTIVLGWNYSTLLPWLANGFITWYLWKASNILASYITSHFSPATSASTSSTVTSAGSLTTQATTKTA
jgi:hypothetical protein